MDDAFDLNLVSGAGSTGGAGLDRQHILPRADVEIAQYAVLPPAAGDGGDLDDSAPRHPVKREFRAAAQVVELDGVGTVLLKGDAAEIDFVAAADKAVLDEVHIDLLPGTRHDQARRRRPVVVFAAGALPAAAPGDADRVACALLMRNPFRADGDVVGPPRIKPDRVEDDVLPPLAVLIFEFPQSAVFLGVNGQLRRVGQVVEVKRIKSAFGNRDLPEIDIVAVADILARHQFRNRRTADIVELEPVMIRQIPPVAVVVRSHDFASRIFHKSVFARNRSKITRFKNLSNHAVIPFRNLYPERRRAMLFEKTESCIRRRTLPPPCRNSVRQGGRRSGGK